MFKNQRKFLCLYFRNRDFLSHSKVLKIDFRTTCGGGERTRERKCSGGRVGQAGCEGKPTDFENCSTNSILETHCTKKF